MKKNHTKFNFGTFRWAQTFYCWRVIIFLCKFSLDIGVCACLNVYPPWIGLHRQFAGLQIEYLDQIIDSLQIGLQRPLKCWRNVFPNQIQHDCSVHFLQPLFGLLEKKKACQDDHDDLLLRTEIKAKLHLASNPNLEKKYIIKMGTIFRNRIRIYRIGAMHLNSLRRSFGNFVQCIFKISMRVVDRFKINDLIVLVLGRIQKLRTLIFTLFWRSNFELFFSIIIKPKHSPSSFKTNFTMYSKFVFTICLNYVWKLAKKW